MTQEDHDAILVLTGEVKALTIQVQNLAVCVQRCQEQRDKAYVTFHRFRPVEMIAYGLVGGAMIVVLTQLLQNLMA